MAKNRDVYNANPQHLAEGSRRTEAIRRRLVDIDPMSDKLETLLYSGMTRATVRLELLVKEDNPLNEPYLSRG